MLHGYHTISLFSFPYHLDEYVTYDFTASHYSPSWHSYHLQYNVQQPFYCFDQMHKLSGRPASPVSCFPAFPINQRGNRREPSLFEDGDYTLYLDLLAEASVRASVKI